MMSFPSTQVTCMLPVKDMQRARRFYERLGFRQEREVRHGYADGTDGIRYSVGLDALRDALESPGGP